jgi:sugar lactone lactonase YvrE
MTSRWVIVPALSISILVGGARPAGAGTIRTVAGTGQAGYNGDGIPATGATCNSPFAVAFGADGAVYFSDASIQRVRRVDAATGLITTVAGIGSPGYSGDGGLATKAELAGPTGLAVSPAGDLYIADTVNCCVRKVASSTGVITTVAGVMTCAYNGDGLSATVAQLSGPQGLSFDAAGNLYIADRDNHRIRKVDAATGLISTVAGTGSGGYGGDGGSAAAATLKSPASVAVDAGGNLYVADTDNHRVRRVDAATGSISTVAGTGSWGYNDDGIAASAAELNSPTGVALDRAGDLYIADRENHRVRRVDAATGKISTVGGTGVAGFNGDGIPAVVAELNKPQGVAIDSSGVLYVADRFNQRVRAFDPFSPAWETLRKGSILIAPNVLDPAAGRPVVGFHLQGNAGGRTDVALYNAAGRCVRIMHVVLDATGAGEASYSSAGASGRPLGPGVYWAVASGGGVNDRKPFFVAGGAR